MSENSRVGSEEIPPCHIRIDKEGRWYYEGKEIVRKEIVLHFYAHLEQDEEGRLIIHWRGERCRVDVEDAPFVIERVESLPSLGNGGSFRILLNDETEEELDPETLWIGQGNVPYCRVKGRAFKARFSRKAYYEMARYIEEDSTERGHFYLPCRGRLHPIRMEDPTQPACKG